MRRTLFSTLLLLVYIHLNADEDFCGIRNTAFGVGEYSSYIVYYKLGVYVPAGEAKFNITLEQMDGRPVYHIAGVGSTYGFYDGIFKVRDRYETYIDTASMQPLKFIRNVNEGTYKKYENVTFNKPTSTAITNDGVYKVPNCVQDVVSSIYYARNLDFSKYKVNDTIPFSMFLDRTVYSLYIRFMCKETIKTRYCKFHAFKFKPLLIKGTIFTGGEKMTVWVSDDANHLPLRVESPISVGSIDVDMMGYRNLKYPLSSLISVR